MYRFATIFIIFILINACSFLQNKLPDTSINDFPKKFTMYSEKPDYNTEWWKEFNNPELNNLVDMGINENFNILEAYARLEQVKAQAAKAGAYIYPEIALNANAQREVLHKKELKKDIYSTNLQLGLSVNYELDIWGRVRSNIKSEKLRLEATKEDLNAAIMSISGQIVETWLNIISLNEQQASLEEQLKINKNLLDIIRLRFINGTGSAIDVLQQEQSVAAIESAIIPIKQNRVLLKHQLALLLGKPANYDIEIKEKKLPEINSIPKLGLPADLLSMRPDIRAAGLRLKSSNWLIASARANRLPTLSLSASMNYNSNEVSNIFDDWIANLAGNLVMPIFDAGRRKNEVKRVKAVVDERLATYKKTLLTAVKEVEDALVTEKFKKESLLSKKRQLDISEKTLKQASIRYLKGSDDYLPILREKLNVAVHKNSIIQIKTDVLISRIQLYKALGGTWTDKYTKNFKSK
jgi:NodT family efflux transporter outer membrane factor (OMF) lipoprotein